MKYKNLGTISILGIIPTSSCVQCWVMTWQFLCAVLSHHLVVLLCSAKSWPGIHVQCRVMAWQSLCAVPSHGLVTSYYASLQMWSFITIIAHAAAFSAWGGEMLWYSSCGDGTGSGEISTPTSLWNSSRGVNLLWNSSCGDECTGSGEMSTPTLLWYLQAVFSAQITGTSY